MELEASDVVTIHPFTQQREGDEVIIGNSETGVFLALPPQAVELLEELAKGKSIAEASALHELKYGEKPDMADFLGFLETKGMVGFPGEASNQPGEQSSAAVQRRRYHFSSFPQSLAKLAFSGPALACCMLLITLALVAIFLDSSLAPTPNAIFFPDYRTLSWTILIIFDMVAVFVHEMGHLIAARAAGVNSRMGISNRLWMLVAETDLTGLWAIPKRRRYLPLLAGMLIDAVSATLLVFLLFASHRGFVTLPTFATRLIRAFTFAYSIRILWEFFLFVRTDIYYVIATYFGCKNLLADTEVFLRNQVARVVHSIRVEDQSAIPAAERRAIRAYSLLWLTGRIGAVAALFWVTVPVGLAYIRNLAAVFRTGYAANPSNFIDAVILAIYVLVPTIAGFVLWTRGFITRRKI